ncbi:hypothetical protein L1D19_23480 [Vibrio natriegens]|uniref:hypothetical protein n=1 Tax=Vibrio natriegens TaxID=691 RepID=UPI001EFC6A1D|nr:hypothetical protein [Vibrio natriegens]MCG9703030.1 hypothetical protein [Vibrio natriegens]
MKPSIEKLDAGLQEIIKSQGHPSKAKIIRGLFTRITEAMDEGITLDMLTDYLCQNDVLVTKNTLRNTLYRIRKEQGVSPKKAVPIPEIRPIKSEPVISLSSHENKSLEEPKDEFDFILEKYHQCDNQIDKYIALGGKREDIEDKSRSTQRDMVMTLRNKLRRKYRGI